MRYAAGILASVGLRRHQKLAPDTDLWTSTICRRLGDYGEAEETRIERVRERKSDTGR